jgi:hypothetical protein
MRHFAPSEILPPEYGNSEYWLKRLMSPQILNVSDALRDEYGKTFINTPWNEVYKDSGFRSIASFLRLYKNAVAKDYDKYTSTHPRGLANDHKFEESFVDDVFEDIIKNNKHWYNKGIRRLEAIELTDSSKATKSDGWLHADVLPTGYNDIVVITYTKQYTIPEYRKIRHTIG